MSIEPTPSFPSLRSLLERLPDDGDPYTNGVLFEYADADVNVSVIDRPTPTPVVMGAPPVAPRRRRWELLVAPLAFVLGIGATITVERAISEVPARAAAAGLEDHGLDAAAGLRLVTEVEVVDATTQAPGQAAAPAPHRPRAALAAPTAPDATPIAPAATPIEPAATPIEPATTSEREAARDALRAALVDDQAPRIRAFDREAARLAVNASARAAKACADGDLTGDATVTVTFAHSGNATSALVSGTLAGTEMGSCIANVMRGTHVPAYEGDLVSVRRLVRIR